MDDDWDDEEIGEWDDDDELDLVECPNCGTEIYEEAQQCPACGEYVVHGQHNWSSGKPVWYILLALAGIVAVVLALSGAL